VLEPDPQTLELRLTQLHPGGEIEQARERTGWPLAVAPELRATAPPTHAELSALRELVAR
jgi:glutaconate CoA-transferase subunit B